MIRRWLLTVPLALGLTTATAAAGPPLTGVLTQVTGAVEVAGPGVQGDPLASPWQVVRAGVTVRVPAGGVAGIACSNNRFIRLQGPASWSLTEQACARGQELTPAEYALVAPQAGRFKVVDGLLVLEREIRAPNWDNPLAPTVLSPRYVMRSPRPAVTWIRVPSATEYRIELSGSRVHYETRLDAAEAVCASSPESIDLCSLPWPADRPDLPPGQTFFLGVAAHEGIAEPWHTTDPVEVRTPALADAAALETRLRHLESLGLEGTALATARAGVLAEAGLYADAAEAYRHALAAPSPAIRVTLADVYLVSGLPSLAEPRYREALADSSPSVQAAATFGLGRVEYARGRYREAATLFQRAHNLYRGLNLGDEEAAARRAADKAAARAPQ
jgi:tetratricopeptide (TPR) repeat protein